MTPALTLISINNPNTDLLIYRLITLSYLFYISLSITLISILCLSLSLIPLTSIEGSSAFPREGPQEERERLVLREAYQPTFIRLIPVLCARYLSSGCMAGLEGLPGLCASTGAVVTANGDLEEHPQYDEGMDMIGCSAVPWHHAVRAYTPLCDASELTAAVLLIGVHADQARGEDGGCGGDVPP